MTSPIEITADLRRRLHLRYDKAHFSLIEEVGNGAGFGNSGWVDALAMSLWPSRGLTLYGFEVKASRSDWRRELDKPEKNRLWQERVDEWYIVAPKDVVSLDELPAAWGLMVPSGKDGLRIVSRSEMDTAPKTVTREMLCAVFRLARKTVDGAQREANTAAYYKIREQVKEACKADIAKREEVESELREFKEAMGLHRWSDLDEVRERAKLLESIDLARFSRTASMLRDKLRTAADALDAIAEGSS